MAAKKDYLFVYSFVLKYTLSEEKKKRVQVTRVATPWPASAPPMTPRGEEAAASAAWEERNYVNTWCRGGVAW